MTLSPEREQQLRECPVLCDVSDVDERRFVSELVRQKAEHIEWALLRDEALFEHAARELEERPTTRPPARARRETA